LLPQFIEGAELQSLGAQLFALGADMRQTVRDRPMHLSKMVAETASQLLLNLCVLPGRG
jgi:hypothetical protein